MIDRLKKAIEGMPENGGTHARKYIGKGNKKLTVDYDLLAMVAALEKLTVGDSGSRWMRKEKGSYDYRKDR